MWLPLALRLLSIACLLQFGLLAATSTRPVKPYVADFERAAAAGKKQSDAGHQTLAIATLKRAVAVAHQNHDLSRESSGLRMIGASQIRSFQYGPALESLNQALELATEANDKTNAGAAAVNLSTIYEGLGDFSRAEFEAEQSVRFLETSENRRFAAKALLNLAAIQADNGSIESSRAASAKAIAVAHAASVPDVESWAWDQLGTSLLLVNRLAEAENALAKADQLAAANHDTDGLAFIHEHLAELELKKPNPNLQKALSLVNQAIDSRSPEFKESPQYYPIHIRGLLLFRLGRQADALNELQTAVTAADEWRRGALPGDSTSTRTVTHLHEVYQDYTEVAASMALDRHDSLLARRALEALAENRAASLREQMTRSLGSNLQLPPEYFRLLSEIQEIQARVTLGKNLKEDQARLDAVRLQLGDLENQIGLQFHNSANRHEINPHRNSLRSIQLRLGDSEVLLSFCLGKTNSYLWAVTRGDVDLFKLPAETEIRSASERFALAVRTHQDSNPSGQLLARELFSQLPPNTRQKKDWLIVGDGALLDSIPFSALPVSSVSGPSAGGTALVSQHTLRFLPTEALLAAPRTPASGSRFVGIGDPIYNLADSRRFHGAHLVPAATKTVSTSLSLARLVGSEREIRSAAALAGAENSDILVGADASGESLRHTLDRNTEILHFAVHVVSPPGRPEQAALALSLNQNNVPELLTPEVIATYRVPGSLVVLSGCASEQGKALPGAGLMGLSRAWLLAGASAVVVSAWPTPDDSGQFFASFYSHLQAIRSGSLAQRAAAALEQTQIEMQRGGGYRTSPSFWAAYSIISKE